jgi:hypothetical protein
MYVVVVWAACCDDRRTDLVRGLSARGFFAFPALVVDVVLLSYRKPCLSYTIELLCRLFYSFVLSFL